MRGDRSISDERPAETADVVAVYQIVLGRNPESDAAIETYLGKSIGDVISQFLCSAEMTQAVADTLANGAILHPIRLTAADFGHAAAWLGAEIDDVTLEASASWWLLIDRFVNGLWRAGLGRDVEAALNDYAALVALRADEDKSTLVRMQSGMAFDPDWFARAHAQAIATFSAGAAVSPARYFLSAGRLHGCQLLAAFSENMPQIYAALASERRSSLRAHVDAVVEAAGRGETGHWLFAADFCRQIRIRHKGGGGLTGAPISYLQFLLDGDRQQWAPHPLFCHHAYRLLNALTDGRPAFEDYLVRGMFEGCRTSILFDPDYYLALHSIARFALLRGTHHDALHHFLTVGIYQDLAFSPDVDIGYYLELYPDVVQKVASGEVPSASWHFLHRGLIEGRRPNRYFDPHYYAQRQPHVAAEMAYLGIASSLEHFLLVGRMRGFKAEPPLAERQPLLDEAKVIFYRRALRSLDKQRRVPLDFRPFAAANPKLSVIVPVCNEAPFTAMFLECAYFAAAHMVQSDAGGVEVIVVDNGSTDPTAPLIERSNGVTSVQFEMPIGYPRAIEAGLAVASGEFIIVANNDVSFQPDAFGRMVAELEADDSIGVLGPLVILPNETLQEAGSFVDRNGGIVNLGRFENPWDAYFGNPIDADYCAGCFFGFRRDDLRAIGGLDEAFSPGYYEDVDLSFRMRAQLGKRAVVIADVQVVHFEHASFGKGRPPSSAFAAIERNRTLFAGKHSDALRDRPTASALAPNGLASTTAIGRHRMLVIAETIPHSGSAGSGVATIAAIATAGLAFELLVLRPDPDVDEFEDPMVTVRRGWMPGEDPGHILADIGRRFSHVLLLGRDQLARFAPLLEAVRQKTGLRILCDTGGLQTPGLLGGSASLDALLDGIRLELRTSTVVSLWIACDQRERRLIEAAGLGRAIAIATPPLEATTRPDRADRNELLLLGGARTSPEALSWLAEHMPQCRSAPILVCGGWQTRLALRIAGEAPEITPEIVAPKNASALRALHDRCLVAVAPPFLRSLPEVLQAMAFEVPVILSRRLAEALREDGAVIEDLAIAGGADGEETYGAWFDRLADDGDAWSKVQRAQRALLAARRQTMDSTEEIGRLITLS